MLDEANTLHSIHRIPSVIRWRTAGRRDQASPLVVAKGLDVHLGCFGQPATTDMANMLHEAILNPVLWYRVKQIPT